MVTVDKVYTGDNENMRLLDVLILMHPDQEIEIRHFSVEGSTIYRGAASDLGVQQAGSWLDWPVMTVRNWENKILCVDLKDLED